MNWATLVLNVAVPLALPPVAALGWAAVYRATRRRYGIIRGWIYSASAMVLVNVIHTAWLAAASGTVSLAVALAIWWWRRKNMKRAVKALGYKARARLAAVVRRAREAAQPRPILQPQRGGAA